MKKMLSALFGATLLLGGAAFAEDTKANEKAEVKAESKTATKSAKKKSAAKKARADRAAAPAK